MKSTQQVADDLGITSNHVRLLVKSLNPQPERLGERAWLWTAEDIERLRARLVGRGRWTRKPKEELAPD